MPRGRGYCVEGVYTGYGSYASGGGFYGSEEESGGGAFEGFVGPLRATVCELRDTSPVGSYWLTKLIVVANFVVALFTGGILFLTEEYAYSTYPSAACIASGGYLPGILLSMFSHANFVHLLGNMAYLYIIGDNIEITLGRLRYLAVYLASGIAGAFPR
jgi:membrane associated rhomboid family serine protease